MPNAATEAEYRRFHNSRLADKMQASRLLDSQLGTTATDNNRQPRIQNKQQQQQPSNTQTNRSIATSGQEQLKQLRKELKKTKTTLAKKHSELGQFYKMFFSQWIPISTTGGATLFEVLDGGLISLVVTGFAIMIRFFWFFLQSPKTKLWLRTKQLVQATIMSAISMIPFVGVLLQPDLISTAVITPYASWKKIQSLRSEVRSEKKKQKKLQQQIKSIKLQVAA